MLTGADRRNSSNLKTFVPQLATADHKKNKAVVLLSGGLDSATVTAWLIEQGFEVIALTVNYGQRHAAELRAASKIAELLGVTEHLVQRLDLRAVGGSALTSDLAVPKSDDPLAEVADDIPVTYVPARNTLFLSMALGLAEARGAHDLAIGVNALDYSGYPDCRPEFIEAFAKLANLATRDGVQGQEFKIHTPLQDLSKLEILQLAGELGVPVDQTLSCYDPSDAGEPCQLCDSCRLRQRAQKELVTWDSCSLEVEIRADVAAAEVRELRHRNLRPGQPFERVLYDIDDLPDTVHFLALIDGKAIGCLTLLSDPQFWFGMDQPACELRLRGMAIDEVLRSLGVGTRLMRAAQAWANQRGQGIWCNSRSSGIRFYARTGFRRIGREFEMPDIGPHYVMAWPGA